MNLVFDNIIYSKEKQGGISNYWYEVTCRAIKNLNFDCFFYEEKGAELNLCRNSISIDENCLINHLQLPPLLARLQSLSIPINDFFIYHSSFYRPVKNKVNFSEVTTIHDFIHNYYAPVHKRLLHNRLKYGAIKRSEGVICVSQNTCNDLYAIFGPLKHKEVAVIHNGVSNDYHPLDNSLYDNESIIDTLKLRDAKFLIYVGGRTNYKNFDFAVKLLDQLPKFKLVVVGGALTEKELKTISPAILNQIVVSSFITNKDLNVLYNHAHCLIYPSSYEGFGIPVIEAMRAGCPVIALNKSSIPEIAGNAALLHNNLDVTHFAQSVKYLDDSSVRSDLIAQGFVQSENYSWDKCAEDTLNFYKHIYSKQH